MTTNYAYGHYWSLIIASVLLVFFFVSRHIPVRTRLEKRSGIILATTCFLIQWPTLLTLIIFPFVVRMYYQLAMREERDVMEKFQDEYQDYRRRVPAFVPTVLSAHRSRTEYEAV